ncbi:hypothetical protein [Simiaoa sunii]|jgi:ABC-type lipoprotein release transport system permease subunit|uniref:DUF3221 domain-containing protein n=1 Tax=Simiaoa sunii TaxID=2763672 RepID=A0A7G9FXG0_9FIRM|nr:hypothetical protein [Simiaoa sunii]QNM03242.1 hypothetical protein H9Q77_03635 [Simiaoa sunii]
MKKPKFICTIVVFIAISLGVILFFSMASTEGKQDYFEGKVLENSDDYIVIKINSSYEKLISKLGENVKIEKTAVVKECDFSKFISNESVRVLYSGINPKKHELEHIFAIYTLSEIQEIVPSR